ncbi:bcl-2 homologous antagonist/killer isoform X1 [Kogia breviceps]|uniref:bcl-2 homologous antagonist/killer isoform X1 n=1 Tax=Kogia breviceps TaxID=27615 RepID=UPI0034D1BA20
MIAAASRVPRAVLGPAEAASRHQEFTDALPGSQAWVPDPGSNHWPLRISSLCPAEPSRAWARVRAEEQVARDTEEVFRSYVFYRHQQEQEAEGAAAPTDPEMVTLPLEPSSIMGQVGHQLAIIGDDINRRYDSEFQAMLQHLQPTAENAYEYFTKIASSLFESGINWGRVVALLGFGYRLALHVYQRGLTGFLGQVTRFVADFMLHHCIARWIAQRGGWVAALDLGNGPIWNVLIVLAVVLLGQFVVRRFFKS